MFRRVATRFSHGTHWDLGMVIYHEKMVSQSLRKMIEAKRQASTHLAKWLKSEANSGLRDLFMTMYEVDTLWTELLDNYMEQYEHYRKQFKEILTETKEVDEARKNYLELKGKTNKLEKQLDHLMKKGEGRKLESTQLEYIKAKSLVEESQLDLEAKTDALNINKHCKAREAVRVLAEANRVLHENGLHVAMAQQQLVTVLMPRSTPTRQTKEGSFKSKMDSARVVGNLSDKIELPRPRKYSEIDVGYTFKTHQYIPSKELLMQEFSRPVQRKHLSGRPPQPLPVKERSNTTWQTESSGSGEYAIPGEQTPEPPPRPDKLTLNLKIKPVQVIQRRRSIAEPRPVSLEMPSPSDFENKTGTGQSSGSGASYLSISQINGRISVSPAHIPSSKSEHPLSPKEHPLYRSCSDPNILDSIERSRRQWSVDSDSDDPDYMVFNG
ncbi:uncharacterized protein LOC106169769 [Lingula anatina]|uniref:Uncharacterized protein LOC106169769 n=1 Tax=Lingula anatina TaxID=7574 RepID=A0A1S3J3J9_LINAN|nr:uncharacterized protein LOC106169769 [Lingula anatina]|eukprot:XP_013404833.1 uncharacterized protein LOC106169769 [Lingula anatina]